MTERRTVPCHGCGWRYAGALASSTAADHAKGCPVWAVVERRPLAAAIEVRKAATRRPDRGELDQYVADERRRRAAR